MHHTAAFNSSLAASTLAAISALSDNVLAIQNNNFIFEDDHGLLYCQVESADLQRARLVTPKLRVVTTPFIDPINAAAVPAAEPRVADYRQVPFLLEGREEFSIEAFQSNAGAQEVTAIVGLDWGQQAAPFGQTFTLRGTSTTVADADVWTQIAMTWNDALPVGRYAIVGMRHQSTTPRAARLILDNTFPRPGCISIPTVGARAHDMFYRGGLGTWGYFVSTRMPNVEVLCNAADASHIIMLDIVKVG